MFSLVKQKCRRAANPVCRLRCHGSGAPAHRTEPSMALLGAGVGTLLFQLCTRRQVPIFLGSSFAFIAPSFTPPRPGACPPPCSVCLPPVSCTSSWPRSFACVGWASCKLLPPVVIGPVIMVIGLSVAQVACNMAMGRAGGEQVVPASVALTLAGISLAVTLIAAVFCRAGSSSSHPLRRDRRLRNRRADGSGELRWHG